MSDIPAIPASSAPPGAEVFTSHHLELALDNLVAPGVIVAGDPGPGAVFGCRLMGGGIMVAAALAAGTVVRHQEHHLADLAHDDINVAIVLEGGGSVEVTGARFQIGAGDLLYLPARAPATTSIDMACRMVILRLSFSRLNGGQRGNFSDFRASLALPESGLRQAVLHYVRQVLPALADSSLATVAHAEQAFVSLLAAGYTEARHATSAAGELQSRWDMVVLAVDTMLADPELNVGRLAEAVGVSTRRVHRLFEEHGQRYGAYLLEQRLQRAREDLLRPLYAEQGVAQAGYRAGFNSASHFSRCFKQRYGVSPSEYVSGVKA
ncbi:AraC family transcriptional regulator [Duganella aceris]|uniref:AraC family transcriptional regulator n=1 Tax=Duganella aceris TaxID=2703883 RepID=A0ABX0FL08_9BURK|nr:AraC family transcriptional regulator [Duganella aceris]NGZ85236.1 AraC family transcriptional regulator [Duganella aceris]